MSQLTYIHPMTNPEGEVSSFAYDNVRGPPHLPRAQYHSRRGRPPGDGMGHQRGGPTNGSVFRRALTYPIRPEPATMAPSAT
jgi:hypothetical protein